MHVAAAINAHRRLAHVPSRDTLAVEPEPLNRCWRSKLGEAAPTSRSRASGVLRRTRTKASRSCGRRLLALTFPKAAMTGRPVDAPA